MSINIKVVTKQHLFIIVIMVYVVQSFESNIHFYFIFRSGNYRYGVFLEINFVLSSILVILIERLMSRNVDQRFSGYQIGILSTTTLI